ncbi:MULTISPECIES: hypothetical protein [unclassified Rickettsia]|uniref:hypothetical protein n=1 Tax=unclassified Rickettsia TaxID=114295 RepID=UPI003133445C
MQQCRSSHGMTPNALQKFEPCNKTRGNARVDQKLIKNSSLRSHEVAAAIQAIPNVMRDLI